MAEGERGEEYSNSCMRKEARAVKHRLCAQYLPVRETSPLSVCSARPTGKVIHTHHTPLRALPPQGMPLATQRPKRCCRPPIMSSGERRDRGSECRGGCFYGAEGPSDRRPSER